MDEIQIEVLEDGTISCKTDQISQTNHYSADQFLAEIEEMAGGKRTITKRKETAHVHRHSKQTIYHSH